MKFELSNLSFKYQPVANKIATRLRTAMPSMAQIRAGRMETYRRGARGDFEVKFPHLSIEYGPAPLHKRHVRMARGRKGWQVILFEPSAFVAWLNEQPEAIAAR